LQRRAKDANRYMEVSETDVHSHDSDTMGEACMCSNNLSNFAKRSQKAFKFIMVELEQICNTLATMGLDIHRM